MTTITLPPEIDQILKEAAREQGTTPEKLAIDSLRALFAPSQAKSASPQNRNLLDFLDGFVGTVDGTTEALSENCGERFTQIIDATKQRKNP